jgi:hypothetical protein
MILFLFLFYSRTLSPLSNISSPYCDKLAKVLVFYLSAEKYASLFSDALGFPLGRIFT